MIAGTLEIQLTAGIARITNDMQQVTRVVGGAMLNVEGAVNSAKKALGALGIGLSVGFFANLIKGAVDAMDHLRNLSKSTGLTSDELAGLRMLAKLTGTELEGLATGLNKMSVAIGKDPEKFKALGVTAKDNKEAFKQLADIFNQLPDIQQRNALAAAVFGKSWAELAPALSRGSKEIGEIMEKGARMSGVTDEMTKQASDLSDKWAELTKGGGLLNAVVGPMLPLFNLLADSMLEVANGSRGVSSAINPILEVFKVLVVLGANVKFTFETIGKEMSRFIENIKLIAQGKFDESRMLGEVFRQDAEKARRAVDTYSAAIMDIGKRSAEVAAVSAQNDRELNRSVRRIDPAVAAAAAARAAAFLKEDKAASGAADAVGNLILQLKKELDAISALEGESADYNKLVREITDGTKKWTEAQIAHALALQGEIDDIKRLKKENEDFIKQFKVDQDMKREAAKEEAEAIADMAKTRATLIKAIEEQLDVSRDELEVARLEASLMNETEPVRRQQVLLLQEELSVRRQIKNLGVPVNDLERDTMLSNARQSALNRSLSQQVRDEAADALRVQTDMWQTIERTAHDTFISIFDSGKNAFERLRDTLKNTLFDLLYQMTIKKWIIQITAAIGGQGVATSAFGALNVANATGTGSSSNGLMNLLGLGSNIGSLAGGGSGGLFGSFAGSSFGQSLGLATTAEIAGPTLTGAGLGSATTLTAAGSTLSYAIPIIGAAVAAYFLLHKDKVSAVATADMIKTFGPMGMISEAQGGRGTGSGGDTIDAMFNRFNTIVTQLGATFDQVSFNFGANTGREGQNPMVGFRSYVGAQEVFSSGEIPAAQIDLAASRAILAALKGSNLPGYLAKVFDNLQPAGMDQAQIDAVLQFAGALKLLRDQLSETRQPLDIARDAVKLMSGALKTTATTAEEWKVGLLAAIDAGIGPEALAQWQALGQAIDAVNASVAEAASIQSALVDRFSTEAERVARAQQTVIDAFAGYGVTIPQTRAEFVALAAAFDPATAEGQRFIRELNAIADAFELITPEVEALAEVVQDTSNVLAINNKRNELTVRILELQGRAQDALNFRRMLEYDAIKLLDQSLLPLLKQIYMLEDAQVAATTATIDHAQAISDAESLLRDAYQREISEKESLIQRMGGYVQSLRQYREQLTFNDPSLSPENRYAGTRQLFEQTSRAAGLGDMDAIGRLQQTSQDFLEASRFYNASSPAFQADMQAVIAAVANSESVATRTVDVAQLQLDALNEQRNAILGVETAVLSVRDALANLESKIIASGNSNSEGNAAMLDAINGVQGAVENVGTEIRRAA